MKKLILFIGFVTLSTYSFSQCQKGDCKNGFSTKKYTDATYEGNFKDEKYDGLGLMFYNDSRIYHGEYKDNTFNGHGYYKWKSGSSYFGSWKNGLQSGLGIQKSANGEIQSAGIWVEGKNSNPLISTSPEDNPENCTGNCVDGIGKLISEDSVTFLGIFKDKKIVLGKIQSENYIYDGEIKNGVPHGYGHIKYTDPNEYFLGYFNNGQKHGLGIFTNNKNKKQYGNWIDNEYQDPNKFEFEQKDFCKELIALAKLSKKERHKLKVKEKHASSTTLEKQFLNQFELRSDSYADDFSGNEKIFLYFPDKNENKPTIKYEEFIDACKQCKKLTSSKDSYFKYNEVELHVGKYTSIMTLTYPKPDPCISGNCKNGKGKKQFKSGIYEGKFKNAQRSGKGKYTWNNEDTYEGAYKNGKRNGKGIFIWKSGAQYEGDFVDDFRTGKGKYIWANGSFYEGDFIKNKFEGKTTFTYASGDVYVGYYKNGKQHGNGTLTWVSGSKYIGEFKDGLFNGMGKKYYSDGKLEYEGSFENDKISGQGTKYYSNGKHVGEFKDNLRHGFGKFYDSKGTLIFEGEYKDNKAHGKGISYYTNGKKAYEGNYENNKRNGQGTKYYTDGKYVGEFKDDLRHGFGKFYNSKGELTFEGQYKDNKKVQ